MLFASVIVDISLKQLDKPFEYIIPEKYKDIEEGTCVLVPFGRGNRLLEGYVIDIKQESSFDKEKLKEIYSVKKEKIKTEQRLIKIAGYIRRTTGSTMNAAIKAVMPVKKEVKFKEEKILKCDTKSEIFCDALAKAKLRNYKAQLKVFNALNAEATKTNLKDGINYKEFKEKYDLANTTLKSLSEKNIIEITSYNIYRNPYADIEKKSSKIVLNDEQLKIKNDIINEYEKGDLRPDLLHGITGSGKTAVYIELVKEFLKLGKSAIVLIPEIALTLQNVKRFYAEFGDSLGIIHSRLSFGERYDQYVRAKEGKVKVMIGPRSALFTPFMNLGLIIIDEEHESSYQNENIPKYHAVKVAEYIAKEENVKLVLGSATPSLYSYKSAMDNRFILHKLTKRAVKNAALPAVKIVDMRQEFANKNRSIFSNCLKLLIEEKLKKKEQIMLFINRRGYSGFVSCRQCGEVLKCPHCSVSLKAHKIGNKISLLKCHYCGYETDFPNECPSCKSRYIGTFGLGTQKVCDEVTKYFPFARVLRMDADTTKKKFGHDVLINEFSEHNADILVGTQMIVKGHDFKDVTLVGILAADLSLNAPGFDSNERTFDLIVQAAGRAGRDEKAGDVIIQTYAPDNYAINTAASSDYEKFYECESNYRRLLHYPPFSHILEMFVISGNEQFLRETADKIKDELTRVSKESVILGPVEAGIYKVNDLFRMYIYVKNSDITYLRKLSVEYERKLSKIKGLEVQFKVE